LFARRALEKKSQAHNCAGENRDSFVLRKLGGGKGKMDGNFSGKMDVKKMGGRQRRRK